MLKNNKGITLIALVITIIVLLILAGVSIAMLTGNNGLLTKATSSKIKTNDADAAERVNLELDAQMANAMAGSAFDTAATIESNLGTLPTGYSATATVNTDSVTITLTTPNDSGLTTKEGKVEYNSTSKKWTMTQVK